MVVIVYWNSKKKEIKIHYNSEVIIVRYKISILLHKQKFYFSKFKDDSLNKLIDNILITGKRIYKLKRNNCKTIISGEQIEYRYIN